MPEIFFLYFAFVYRILKEAADGPPNAPTGFPCTVPFDTDTITTHRTVRHRQRFFPARGVNRLQ